MFQLSFKHDYQIIQLFIKKWNDLTQSRETSSCMATWLRELNIFFIENWVCCWINYAFCWNSFICSHSFDSLWKTHVHVQTHLAEVANKYLFHWIKLYYVIIYVCIKFSQIALQPAEKPSRIELNLSNYAACQTLPLYQAVEPPQTYPIHSMLYRDEILDRFLVIQAEIKKFDGSGVFEELTKIEADFELATKNKKQADVVYKVLCEQLNKDKLDYENIASPNVQGYFRTRQDHERAIEKEKVGWLFQ